MQAYQRMFFGQTVSHQIPLGVCMSTKFCRLHQTDHLKRTESVVVSRFAQPEIDCWPLSAVLSPQLGVASIRRSACLQNDFPTRDAHAKLPDTGVFYPISKTQSISCL